MGLVGVRAVLSDETSNLPEALSLGFLTLQAACLARFAFYLLFSTIPGFCQRGSSSALIKYSLQASLCEALPGFAGFSCTPQRVYRLTIDNGRAGATIFKDVAQAFARYIALAHNLEA